jgi:Uma2 family endonuclease
MTTITYPAGVVAPLPPLPPRRWTVDEYHHLLQTAVLQSGEPVELLEGWLVTKMSRNPPHEQALDIAQNVIRGFLPPDWRLRVLTAITTGDSEPEPDLAVIRNPISRYASRLPGPADIGSLVEIADTSLAHDRKTKGRIYARAGIVVYWIVNLVDRQVEVYTAPDPLAAEPTYTQHADYLTGDSVPLVLDGREVARIPVADLLP